MFYMNDWIKCYWKTCFFLDAMSYVNTCLMESHGLLVMYLCCMVL